jgi:hypothetical protein
MLWSCNDDFIGVAVTDGEHPCPTTLAEDCSGQAMKTAVGHSFLDAGITDNVHPVTNLKSLDYAGARWQPPFSQIFLEFIPCFLPWTIVMCHCLFSLLCSFNLRYVEAGDACCFVQDLGKTWTGSA